MFLILVNGSMRMIKWIYYELLDHLISTNQSDEPLVELQNFICCFQSTFSSSWMHQIQQLDIKIRMTQDDLLKARKLNKEWAKQGLIDVCVCCSRNSQKKVEKTN